MSVVALTPTLRTQFRAAVASGQVPVGVGILLQGASQYVVLAIVAHSLGPVLDAAFAAFWSLLSVAGPGFMAPLEQATGRAIAARRALATGTRPVALRAAALGALLCVALIAGCGAAAAPLITHAFDGNAALLPVFAAGLIVFGLHFLARGVLAGHQRFVAYGVLLTLDGLLRVVVCTALALAGLRSSAAYGVAIVAGSFVAAALLLAYAPRLWSAGEPARWDELSGSLGSLVVASLVLQFLVSIGALAVQLLASPSEQTAAARFLSSRVIAFIPLFLFLAVIAPLLPRLTRLATLGDRGGFSRVLRSNILLAIGFGAITVAGASVAGPIASRILFGRGFDLGVVDFALLGAASAGLMLGQVLATALIALRRFAVVAACWMTGAAAFFIVVAAVHPLFERVELALTAGAFVASLAMWAVLRGRAVAPAAAG